MHFNPLHDTGSKSNNQFDPCRNKTLLQALLFRNKNQPSRTQNGRDGISKNDTKAADTIQSIDIETTFRNFQSIGASLAGVNAINVCDDVSYVVWL